MTQFKSVSFLQVSKEIFDVAKKYEDVKDRYQVATSRLILEDKKNAITFCNETNDMKGFIKKEKNGYLLNYGPSKRIYPKTVKKEDIKILDGIYVTFRNI